MNLRSIFDYLTPENIKSIPVVRAAMNVFIDSLERNSEVASRISAIFDQTSLTTDSDIVKKAKATLREGMFQTWIFTLYNTLSNALQTKDIVEFAEKYNYTNAGIYQGLNNLTPEFIQSYRLFSQKVGTPTSLKYIYNFARYLETGEYNNDLIIQEKSPFVMAYEGAISRSMFDTMVKPLAHPIGWVDNYACVITVNFFDLFGVELIKQLTSIELQKGEDWVVFISGTNTEAVYDDFRTRINPLTHKPYTDDEIKEHVLILTNKEIRSSSTKTNADGTKDYSIIFTDETAVQYNGQEPHSTIFTTYMDYLAGFVNPIKVYDESWIFKGAIGTNFRFLYKDNIDNFLKEIFITKIKENNKGKCAPSIYIEDWFQNCFKVGGDPYPFVYGSDEARFRCTTGDEVNTEVESKFNATASFKIFKASKIKIEDDFGHFKQFSYDEAATGTISLNTFGFQGYNYKVTIDSLVGDDYWFRVSGLNDFRRNIILTKVFTENQILRIQGQVKALASQNYLRIRATDANGKTTDFRITSAGAFSCELPVENLADGGYRLDLWILDPQLRIIEKAFYEGCDLKAYSDIEPAVSFLQYGTKPQFNIKSVKLKGTYEMPGVKSTADYITTMIGEKYLKDFYPPMDFVKNYIKDNRIDYDSIPGCLSGSMIEGSIYSQSNFEYLPEEEVFIYKGFRHREIDTSDFWVMDSSKFVTDTLNIDLISNNYYLYTEIESSEDVHGKYLCSQDICYLYTHEERRL